MRLSETLRVEVGFYWNHVNRLSIISLCTSSLSVSNDTVGKDSGKSKFSALMKLT